jgi:hypothetical protein
VRRIRLSPAAALVVAGITVVVFLVVAMFAGAGVPGKATAGAAPTSGPCLTCSPSTAQIQPTPATAPSSVPVTKPVVGTTAPPVSRPPATAGPTYNVYPTSPRYSNVPASVYSVPPTTSVPVTSTTILSIAGHLPVTSSTVPFTTKGTSAHVDALFAWLSGAGFLAALLIMAGRFVMTRPRRTRAGGA